MPSSLTMVEFLTVVAESEADKRPWPDHQGVPERLAARGHHPNVIAAKAEKAARKDYTQYGVVVTRPWLTEKGRQFLAERTTSV